MERQKYRTYTKEFKQEAQPKDVRGLRDFYQSVLEVTAEGDDVFVVLSTPEANLSLFSTQSLEEMAPGLTDDAGVGCCFLEFEVILAGCHLTVF